MGQGGGGGSGPHLENHVAICFLRNTGMDPTQEAIGTLGVQLPLEGGRYGPLGDTQKSFQDP